MEGGHGKIKDSDLSKKDRKGSKSSASGKPSNEPLLSLAGSIGGSSLQNVVGGFLGGGSSGIKEK